MKKGNTGSAVTVVVVALLGLLIVTVGVSAFVITRLLGREDTDEAPPAGLQIGYEEEVGVALDQSQLQAQMDEILSQDSMMSLEYSNNGYSTNGSDFRCYIANSELNPYDMYIGLYADSALTDELFLSKLLRPGTAFDHLTLNHPLDVGSHTIYCVMTQVEEGNDGLDIRNQITITLNFTVENG